MSKRTAAALAIETGRAVQDVPYPLLRERLIEGGQVLDFRKAAQAKGPMNPH